MKLWGGLPRAVKLIVPDMAVGIILMVVYYFLQFSFALIIRPANGERSSNGRVYDVSTLPKW